MDYAKVILDITAAASNQILKLDKNTLDAKPSPEKWSRKEITGHLIDSAYNNYMRMMRALSSSTYEFEGYDQDEWVARNDYQHRPVNEIVLTWLLVNRQFSQLIKNTSQQMLERKIEKHNFDTICMCPLPKSTPASLSYLIADYLQHMEHHLAQIIPDYVSPTIDQ